MHNILTHKPLLDTAILDFLDCQAPLFQDQHFGPLVFEQLRAFIIRGKSLRGGLFLATCNSLSSAHQQQSPQLTQVAAALEIIHAGLLIHDDIIDQDERRRNHNSVWQDYRLAATAKHLSQPLRYGQNQAICVGTICQYLANQLLEQPELRQFINQIIIKTYLAEMLDSQLAANPNLPTEKQVLEMYHFKTALYTFGLPLKAAALWHHLTPAATDQLEQIGSKIGLIFQIQDDLIGLLNSPEQSGKPPLSDVREGKKTIVYLHLLSNCQPEEKQLLKQHFGRQQPLKPAVVATLQQLIRQRALPSIQQLTNQLAQEARQLITQLSGQQQLQKLLTELLEFNLQRQS